LPHLPVRGRQVELGTIPRRLGASLQIKGHITENLQMDGQVDGPIPLRGHELTIGPSAPIPKFILAE
jgi:hypothetical protein